MEIIMKNLSVRSLKDYQKLNHVDYVFKDSAITFCNGLSGALIKDLLFKKKNPLNGYLLVNECGHVSDIGYLGNEVLKEFEDLKIPIGAGNVIFPSGNALKYLGEYFDEELSYSSPYDEDPYDIRAISFSPDGSILNGNIHSKTILDILEEYQP